MPEPLVEGVAPPIPITPVTETLPYSVGLEVICELAILPVICVLATDVICELIMLPLIFVFATERILSFVIAVAPIEFAISMPVVVFLRVGCLFHP